MYLQSVINDYYERNDFNVSTFQYLTTISKQQEDLEELKNNNGESTSEVDTSEDLPF